MINNNFKYDNYKTLLYGNGFALDVYLPALINLGIKQILIDKNQILNEYKRSILNKFKEYIIYFNEKEFNEQQLNFTILAVKPTMQYKLLLENNFFKTTNTLILEKPIASTPVKSFELQKKLEDLKINYLINYSFRYTLWFKKISDEINNLPKNVELFFNWQFMARHFIHRRNTWKRSHSEG